MASIDFFNGFVPSTGDKVIINWQKTNDLGGPTNMNLISLNTSKFSASRNGIPLTPSSQNFEPDIFDSTKGKTTIEFTASIFGTDVITVTIDSGYLTDAFDNTTSEPLLGQSITNNSTQVDPDAEPEPDPDPEPDVNTIRDRTRGRNR